MGDEVEDAQSQVAGEPVLLTLLLGPPAYPAFPLETSQVCQV